ncbi:binding-protein-dependent transporter inner membrane component [Bifidobacterium reuteri DSM 23975]|uniref:Binding-protein-dependent transporter inner membrane component n=1 Tax=Bifidobacterium reuteri DSM 23975 TaxID=1437610 RepID=A0A087CMF4_9BIFI|nr:sugar ABC transporter permease [Bifidobacterium reuteri]KFI84454.1 binding-protein-dependent transporter inner membrane component [Bifidobacterium reuteri DSM 23975]
MTSTSNTNVSVKHRSKRVTDGKVRRNIEIFILSAPAIILFCAFVILPIILGAYYGFYKWKGFGTPSKNGKFVGLQNYVTALSDPNFQAAILHTFEIVVCSLVIQAPLAILFALLLNQKFKGRALIRTLIFVPYVVSEVIVGTGWSLLLQKTGAVNQLLGKIGIEGPDWLADPKIAIWTLLLLISWKYIGFAVILMLAGMQSIPEELYEAARVDGAGFWQMQKSITLPLLAPTLRIWVFLSMIGSLQLFDLVYIIWGQYVSTTAGVSTMATYMVREGRGAGNYGYGSAVALIIFIISLIVALTYQRFVLSRDLDGALTEQKQAKKRAAKRAKEAQRLAEAAQ